ncbi:tRNA1(Val) (adenine(37)-N6)-methyltransferase [Streptobacillus moniliformis]|uniref:tRNA1(Val) (adenine(37)-N6)-methyltransferase n=1 Tax=Streptobacillus moniliformis TaxID=34105 RepID=UPI0007E4047C|nr:methyltransferase [Streptobacillus moniliformis]
MEKYIVDVAGMKIEQIKGLQSFTLDSLLIADYVNINRKSKKILEIGSGFGIISMILRKRTLAEITGVEINYDAYNISLENLKNNNIDNIFFINEDILNYRKFLSEQTYDIIVSNPPYFTHKDEKQLKKNINLRNARVESTLSIKEILNISTYLLKNNASLYLIFRTERLSEIIELLKDSCLEVKRVKPIYTKIDDDKSLICMVEIVKGAKSGFILEKPIYVYKTDGERSEYIEKLYR